MKKFNTEKWQLIQNRKTNLHVIYTHARDAFDHESVSFAKHHSMFSKDFRDYRTLIRVIDDDKRLLTAAEIEVKLGSMRTDWDSARLGFELSDSFAGKHLVIDLYKEMLKLRNAKDNMELAANRQQAFSSCFSTLNEFASKHGRGDHRRIETV